MARKISKKVKVRPKRSCPHRFLEELDPDMAKDILFDLCEHDRTISNRAEKAAKDLLSEIDADDIAASVLDDLNALEVEDVWDSSGSTRHGYVDPGEYAYEMAEEAIEPYLADMGRYLRLKMKAQAMDCALGIIKGLYRYKNEGSNEYKDWADDMPQELAISVFQEWLKGMKDGKARERLMLLVKKNARLPSGWTLGMEKYLSEEE